MIIMHIVKYTSRSVSFLGNRSLEYGKQLSKCCSNSLRDKMQNSVHVAPTFWLDTNAAKKADW